MDWTTAATVIATMFGWACTGVVMAIITGVAVVAIAATAWAAGFLTVAMVESFRPTVSNTAP